jgi:hypothetical protein
MSTIFISDPHPLTQLSDTPRVIVDRSGNTYVTDSSNHHIMRWLAGAKNGSIVVGGNREGDQLNQFNEPRHFSFDRQGNLFVFVVGDRNNRVQKFEIIVN